MIIHHDMVDLGMIFFQADPSENGRAQPREQREERQKIWFSFPRVAFTESLYKNSKDEALYILASVVMRNVTKQC